MMPVDMVVSAKKLFPSVVGNGQSVPVMVPPSLPPCQLATPIRQLPPLLPPLFPRPVFAERGVHWTDPTGSHMHRIFFPSHGPVVSASSGFHIPQQLMPRVGGSITNRPTGPPCAFQTQNDLLVSRSAPHNQAVPALTRGDLSKGPVNVPEKVEVKEGPLKDQDVEILEFSNDDIAGPINQEALITPQGSLTIHALEDDLDLSTDVDAESAPSHSPASASSRRSFDARPESFTEFGDDASDFDDAVWDELGSMDDPDAWSCTSSLVAYWPKGLRSKRRRLSDNLGSSGGHMSSISPSPQPLGVQERAFPVSSTSSEDCSSSYNTALTEIVSGSSLETPNLSSLDPPSAVMLSDPAGRSLFPSVEGLAIETSAPLASSWSRPQTAFLQDLLEDVKKPKRQRGAWRLAVSVPSGTDESHVVNSRALNRKPKRPRDSEACFLGVAGGSEAGGYGDSGGSAFGAGEVDSSGGGWFRSSSSSSLESFSGPPVATPLTGTIMVSNVSSSGVRRCVHCKSTKTPQWRMGPAGPKTLCNACGVRFKKGKLCPEYRPASSPEYEESKHSNQHRKILAMRTMSAAAAS